MIAGGLFTLLVVTLKLLALLTLLIAVAFLLTHGVLAHLSLAAAVVALLLRRANCILSNVGLRRTRRLRLRLALFPLAFAALATLHAGVVFLLPVSVTATALLRCGSSNAHAHGKRDAQSKRPGRLLASGEFHRNSLR